MKVVATAILRAAVVKVVLLNSLLQQPQAASKDHQKARVL